MKRSSFTLAKIAVVVSLISSVFSIAWVSYNWRKDLKSVRKNEQAEVNEVEA